MDAILAVLEKAGRYLLTIRITDLLDIAIMAYLVYKLLSLVKSTRAANILKGVAIFLAALWLSSVLELKSVQEEDIRAQMAELAQKRKSKQPLEYPSAGSMFKRPQGYFAAALIEQCGLKGFTVGGAQVSEKHAGFVINRGGATCADVLALVKEVQRRVREQTGVELEMEVRRLG